MKTQYTFIIFFFAYFTFLPRNALAQQLQKKAQRSAFITGQLKGLKNGDTVTLTKYYYGIDDPKLNETLLSIVNNGKFIFKLINPEKGLTISLRFGLDRQVANPELLALNRCIFKIVSGEQVIIGQHANAISFSGNFAAEKESIYKLDEFNQNYWRENPLLPSADPTLAKEFAALDKYVAKKLAYLNRLKLDLSKAAFSRLVANTIYGISGEKYFMLNTKKINVGVNEPKLVPVEYSEELASYVIEKFKYDSCTVLQRRFQLGKCYNYINMQYKGDLCEYLLTKLLLKYIKSDSLMKYANIALGNFKNPELRNILAKMTTTLTVGTAAYNFQLPGAGDKSYALSDFKGKVVVLDFWFTGCGACQVLNPKLAEIEKKFDPNMVVFVSISADKNKSQWQKSVLEGHYTSGTSLKLFTDGQGFDHPLLKHYNIKGFPTLIVIDKFGKMLRSPIDPRFDEGKDITALLRSAL